MSLTIKKQLVSNAKAVSSGVNGHKYITIHETANTSKGADAQAHANLQSRGNSRAASWHWSVDDKQAIQSFEHTERCWHSGDGGGDGNMNSIGVEICVNSDGVFSKAVDNAAELVRKIMKDEGIPISNVVQHNRWSGKNCPANLRSGSKGINWAQFIEKVKEGTNVRPKPPSKPVEAPNPSPKPSVKSLDEMVKEVIAGKHGNGHDNRRKSLGISASDYEKVHAEVNRILEERSGITNIPKKSINQMAQEIIANKHGNGHENRRKSLGISAAEYAKVRAEVNRLSTAKPSKSIAQMAQEVIVGKHGQGHAYRQKSLGVDSATYAKVRAEVNKRA